MGTVILVVILAAVCMLATTAAVTLVVRESVRRRRRAALRQQARQDLRRAFEARARRGGPRPPAAAARPYHAERIAKAREQILAGVAGEFNPLYGPGSAKSQIFADGWPGAVERGDDGTGPDSGTGGAP